MITFINESLFSKIVEKKDGKDGAPDYYRTIISSSERVINRKNPEKKEAKVIEHVLHTAEDNFNKENTRLNIKWTNDRPFVRLNQKATNKMDMPVFIIAIPYNGFIIPIERSVDYRIYKGFTVTLENPVLHEGSTYKHVAYMTVVPNQKILDTNKLGCKLEVTGFSTMNDSSDPEKKTTYKKVWSIRWVKDENGEIQYDINSEVEVSDAVNMEDYKEKRIFPLPRPKKVGAKRATSENKTPPVINPNKKKKTEQNNPKNIKKPVLNKSDGTFGTPVVTKSLDEMIKDSEKSYKDKQRKSSRNRKRRRR